MSTPKIELSPDALAQVQMIQDWWDDNRPAAPDLFREELVTALETIRGSPKASPSYPFSQIPGLRRMLMHRTRYHVYFTYHEDRALIFVHAVWHASRGRGPKL